MILYGTWSSPSILWWILDYGHESTEPAWGSQDGGRRPSASSRESGSRRHSHQSEHSTISVLSLPSFFKDQSGAGADDLQYLCFLLPDSGWRFEEGCGKFGRYIWRLQWSLFFPITVRFRFFFPNSFSYGVLANIGSGAMPGRLPNDGFREGSGAGSGQGFKEVLGRFPRFRGIVPRQDSGRFRARFQGCSGWVPGVLQAGFVDGTVPERIENDLVADRGTGFRDGSLGEPVAVAVALVPALVLLWLVEI